MTTAAYLYVGAVLFAAGAVGTLIRRSAVGRLVGVEIMIAAATLTFAASGAGFRELEGQVAALVVFVIAFAQATVGFALISGSRRPE